jgi:hypothetical protein
MARFRSRISDQSGSALIIALMAMMLLTALAATVIMVTNTETKIASNYSSAQEALYAADAAIERVVSDLLMVPRWNDILAGTAHSAFVDGDMAAQKTLPGGGLITLCCANASATGQLQAVTDDANLWGANNPTWRLFAWGPLRSILPDEVDSSMYVAVWIADDPAETDDNPLADGNGTLTLRAEAYGPSGSMKIVEATVARTSSTEIERGQIAQRGQEELNQRARKAAVQTPGKTIDNMRLNTKTGGMTVQ